MWQSFEEGGRAEGPRMADDNWKEIQVPRISSIFMNKFNLDLWKSGQGELLYYPGQDFDSVLAMAKMKSSCFLKANNLT